MTGIRTDGQIKALSDRKLNLIFQAIIIVVTLILYYNVIYNHFSMDDYHINIDNPSIAKGLEGIPEIWTTLYADEGGMAYGYRPLARTSFALEYEFTADNPNNPYISHAVSLILYVLAMILLFRVLRRLFRDQSLWFPMLVTLLFMAHPAHTEVVASLKNRDVLLNFIFSFLAIGQFIRWVDKDKFIHLLMGLFCFILALLSKETAIAQLAVFPLVLYFFTDIKPKKLGMLIGASALIVILILVLRGLILPDTVRDLKMWENPLVENDSFLTRISTGMYIIGFYLKLIIIPWPLLFYYGYDTIPVVSFANPWALLSTAIVLLLLIYAILNLKKKSVLSFAILFFFVNISMYTNIVALVPGIVADRFVFFAVLSFAIALVWIIFRAFKISDNINITSKLKLSLVALIIALIIIPYGYYVRVRNTQWRTHYQLYSADIGNLQRSVKANALYAHELMKRANRELAKPVNPYKFILGTINKAEKHYLKVLEIDSTHYTTWNNLGIIYSRIHGNQAKLRIKSHIKYDRKDQIPVEEENFKNYFKKAIFYFNQALKYKPDYSSAYFNLGYAYELQDKYDSSIVYYRKTTEIDGGELSSLSKLANVTFKAGYPREAIKINEDIIEKYPTSDKPYINLGNYAMENTDTINAVKFYRKAVSLGTRPEVGKLLSNYYNSIGDTKSANYFMSKSVEAEQLQRKNMK